MTLSESARAAIKSDSLNLVKPQLDRCLTSEDLHQRLDALRVDVHFGDGRMHGGNGPSMTMTESPIAKSVNSTAGSAASSPGTCAAAAGSATSSSGAIMSSTSVRLSGTG